MANFQGGKGRPGGFRSKTGGNRDKKNRSGGGWRGGHSNRGGKIGGADNPNLIPLDTNNFMNGFAGDKKPEQKMLSGGGQSEGNESFKFDGPSRKPHNGSSPQFRRNNKFNKNQGHERKQFGKHIKFDNGQAGDRPRLGNNRPFGQFKKQRPLLDPEQQKDKMNSILSNLETEVAERATYKRKEALYQEHNHQQLNGKHGDQQGHRKKFKKQEDDADMEVVPLDYKVEPKKKTKITTKFDSDDSESDDDAQEEMSKSASEDDGSKKKKSQKNIDDKRRQQLEKSLNGISGDGTEHKQKKSHKWDKKSKKNGQFDGQKKHKKSKKFVTNGD